MAANQVVGLSGLTADPVSADRDRQDRLRALAQEHAMRQQQVQMQQQQMQMQQQARQDTLAEQARRMEMQQVMAEADRDMKQQAFREDVRRYDKDFGFREQLSRQEQAPSTGRGMSDLTAMAQQAQQYGLEPYTMSTDGKMAFRAPKEVDTWKQSTDETMTALDPQQQMDVVSMARQIGANRPEGWRYLIPSIGTMMQEGLSRDEIQDRFRRRGQSPEFTEEWRDALHSVYADVSDQRFDSIEARLGDFLEAGKTKEALDFVKRSARLKMDAATRSGIEAKQRTVDFLGDVKDDLQEYVENGGNLNLISGKVQDVKNRLGLVGDPELKRIGTQILDKMQLYRRGITGAVFSREEAEEYRQLFPRTDATMAYNMVQIDSLRDSWGGDIEAQYSLALGGNTYSRLSQLAESVGQPLQEPTGEMRRTPQAQETTDDSQFMQDPRVQEALREGYSVPQIKQYLGV